MLRRSHSARLVSDEGGTAGRVASARANALSDGERARKIPKRRTSIGATAGPRSKPLPTPPTNSKVDLKKLEEELIQELTDMSVPRLRKRATDDGVETFDIMTAESQEDPRRALTILLIEHAKFIAKSGGRTRQAGTTRAWAATDQPSTAHISKSLWGAAESLKEAAPKVKEDYEGLAQNSSMRDAERRYVPSNEAPGMRISPAEARRRAAAGGNVDAAPEDLPSGGASKDSAASAADSATSVDDTTSASDSEPSSPRRPSTVAPPEGALARSRRVREELHSLKVSALRKRLHASGVDEEKAEAAEDADDPKATMIELIVEKELDAAGAILARFSLSLPVS